MYLRRRTSVLEHTLRTLAIPRRAHGASMADEQRIDLGPVFLGRRLHQILLHFVLIMTLRESKTQGQTEDVCIHRNAFDLPVRRPQNNGSCLAADPWELNELIHGLGDFAVVLFQEELCCPAEELGFVVVVTARENILLQFLERNLEILFECLVLFEKRCRNQVHAIIGALRTEDGSEEELLRRIPVQKTPRRLIQLLKSFDDEWNSENWHAFSIPRRAQADC